MIPLPRLENGERIVPIKVSITQNINPLSTATMQIRSDQQIAQRAFVELFTPTGSAGWFRTRIPEDRYMNNVTNLSLDHAICEVGDYIVKVKRDQDQETLSQAITRVFSYYGGSRWQLGTISVTGNVVYSLDYNNILSTMNSLISQIPSAMMTFDFSTTPWTINIVNRGTTVVAEGRLGRNISSASVKKDDSNLCTRVWLDGIGINGSMNYMDADTISTYGVIEYRMQNMDYTRTQAQTIASQYLAKHKNPKYSVDIDGIELSQITGETLDRAEIGALYRLAIPKDNVVIEQNVVKLYWPDVYGSPKSVKITLSEEEYSQTQYLRRQQTAVDTAYTTKQKRSQEYSTRFEQTDELLGLYADYTGEGSPSAKEEITARIIELLVSGQSKSGKIKISPISDGYKIELNAYDVDITAENNVKIKGTKIKLDGTVENI